MCSRKLLEHKKNASLVTERFWVSILDLFSRISLVAIKTWHYLGVAFSFIKNQKWNVLAL